jgi:hypothetical protein
MSYRLSGRAILAAACALALGATVALVLTTARSPARAQAVPPITNVAARFATGIVSTDASGFAPVTFVRHSGPCRDFNINLEAPVGCANPMPGRPDVVNVTGVAPITGPGIPASVLADGYTATGFRVRVLANTGAVLANQTVRISYRATSDPDGYCDATNCS